MATVNYITQVEDGTKTAPGYSFRQDTDTGVYRIGANNLGISVGDTKIVDVATTGATIVGTLNTSGNITTLSGNAVNAYWFLGEAGTSGNYGWAKWDATNNIFNFGRPENAEAVSVGASRTGFGCGDPLPDWEFRGNADSEIELAVHNLNAGTSAVTEVRVLNDEGAAGNGALDLFVSSSTCNVWSPLVAREGALIAEMGLVGLSLLSNKASGYVRIITETVERARVSSVGLNVVAGFGCNTKAAQAAYASGGALNAYGAGANGFDSGANASALHAMVVSIRAALVANGIMS